MPTFSSPFAPAKVSACVERNLSSFSIRCTETIPAELSVAFRIEDESRIGFWNALIVAAAAKSGATRLLSEDLNPGQKIAGLRIENPFAAVP